MTNASLANTNQVRRFDKYKIPGNLSELAAQKLFQKPAPETPGFYPENGNKLLRKFYGCK